MKTSWYSTIMSSASKTARHDTTEYKVRDKSVKQQLIMLEQMRKQHQLQSQLAKFNEPIGANHGRSSGSKGVKYNRANVGAAISAEGTGSDSKEIASVVAAVQKKKHSRYVQKRNEVKKSSNVRLEEEVDKIGEIVQNLSLQSSSSAKSLSVNSHPTFSDGGNKSKSPPNQKAKLEEYEMVLKNELEDIDDVDDHDEGWEQTKVSSILNPTRVTSHNTKDQERLRSNSDDYSASVSNADESKVGSESGEDYSDDEDEGEDGYKPGGYHRVEIGETYNQRYDLYAFIVK